MDEDGYYLEVLTAERNHLYLEAKELKGKCIHNVFPALQADLFLGAIRRAIKTGESDFEYQL